MDPERKKRQRRKGSPIRQAIEASFEAWGRFAFRHAWAIIAAALLVSAALSAQIPRLTTDNSTDSFLHPQDPIRLAYSAFREQFGRDEQIILAIEPAEVFDLDFLRKLAALHRELEREVPHLDEIVSLLNARWTHGEGDRLVVEDLLEDWPETPQDLSALRARVLANPLYRNTLVSEDARLTTVSIRLQAFSSQGDQPGELGGFGGDAPGAAGGGFASPRYLTEPESSAAVRAVREVVSRYQDAGLRIYLAGAPVITERLNAAMQHDMRRFLVISVGAISLLLFLLFRRLAAVVLPLLVVVLAMLCTLGIMVLSGVAMSLATQILPSFLIAVGVCDGVHILAIFYQRLARGDDKQEAIAFTLGHSGLAILMTSLTTAGGLASFMASDFRPVADLGSFAPIGVLLALLFSVALLPALLAVIPMRQAPRAQTASGGDRLGRALQGMGAFAAARPWGVVAVTVLILAVSLAGAAQLRFSHDAMYWFPEEEPLRVGTLLMNDRLKGISTLEIVVSTGRENGLHEPARLDQLEEVARYVSSIHRGGLEMAKTISLVDVVKEIHQALNENRPEFYAIPRDRQLVAQELLLFENTGTDDLEDFVDTGFSKARVTVRVPWQDAVTYPPLLEEIETGLAGIFGEDVEVEVTGLVAVLSRTFVAMLNSMARSYVIALLVITPLMILLIGQLWRGLLSMVPNLTPVIMTLGFMGWSGIPLDGSTMMIGAIVIGLAVDDTIHFMHNFRRYYDQTGDAHQAIRQTLETTGRALLLTTLVLGAGFLTFTGAYMKNTFNFGMLAGTAILVAFLANVLLSSSLMVLATQRERTLAERRKRGRC